MASASDIADVSHSGILNRYFGPIVVAAAIAIAYAPTVFALASGPWQTEQDGHGPLIIALALFLVWQVRDRLRSLQLAPAPVSGWASLLFGLFTMFIARTQDVLTFEALSILPVLVGAVLLVAGWRALRFLFFPVAFLIFAVPAPDWAIDSVTVPLKVLISDSVTEVLYALGYPIAQNGVMIMVGTYKLLVKDACSGMNSIFALSAIGVFYAYTFRWDSKARAALLLVAIIPITILANFIRVLALVLLAYYFGADSLEGLVHDFTGIALFVLALVLLILWDAVLGACIFLTRLVVRFWRANWPAGELVTKT